MFNLCRRTFGPLLVIRQHACADLLYIDDVIRMNRHVYVCFKLAVALI